MKKMKKRVAVSCYEFQIVGLERSKRGLRGRPTEDPRDRVLTGLGWRSCVLYFLDSNHRLSALQNVQYSMGKYEIAIPPTCSHITSNGLLNYRCQLQVMGQGATFQGRRCASILSGGATVIYPFQESDCAQHGLCLGDFKM